MTNEKAPERIWIDTDDVAGAQRRGVGSYYVRLAPDDASNREAEYVRADLLATVRKEEREAERKRTLTVIQQVPATAAGADAFKKRVIEEMYRVAALTEK